MTPLVATAAPALSVVVTVLDEGPAAERLVDQVLPQLRPDDELVVVDGGSTDGTVERLRLRAAEEPRILVVEAPGTNISAGRNAGVRRASNDLIATTDAGCDPAPGWLEALRQPFFEPDRPVLVAGLPKIAARGALERAQLACYAQLWEVERPPAAARAYASVFGQRFVPELPFARSLAFSKAVWERVGGFPEHLSTVEDGMFGRLVSQHGRCAFARDAVVTWHQRGSVRGTYRMYRAYGEGAAASGEADLWGRDALRALAYVLGAAAVLSRRRALLAGAAVGALAYWSVPVARVLRGGGRATDVALVPFALAVKDLGKLHGQMSGRRAR